MSGQSVKVKLIKQRYNSGKPPLFFEGQQIGLQVDAGIGQIEFFSDIVAVIQYRIL
jgi:hypothetical protein